MVLYGDTVITEDIDLLSDLLATLHACLDLVYLVEPIRAKVCRYVLLKLGVLNILRVAVDRVDSGVALTISTLLL